MNASLISDACEILAASHPMTLRQLYYQLVVRRIITNEHAKYKRLSECMVEARRKGDIDWEWLVDNGRQPRGLPLSSGVADFMVGLETAYFLDPWPAQPVYIEAWLEKDALADTLIGVCHEYRTILNVGRGYDGWSSINLASKRLKAMQQAGKKVFVHYYGDFDPSGEDMLRSLKSRLAERGATPEIIKVALDKEQIIRYALPPCPVKRTDSRAASFISAHGDECVELDALPKTLLQDMSRQAILRHIDWGAWAATKKAEEEGRVKIAQLVRQS
jgi:hypothetical protein